MLVKRGDACGFVLDAGTIQLLSSLRLYLHFSSLLLVFFFYYFSTFFVSLFLFVTHMEL